MSADDPLIRTLLIVVAAIVLLPVLAMAFMMPMMGLWGGHVWNGGLWDGTGAVWTWLLLSLPPLIVLLALGYLLYRALRGSGGRRPDPAIEELRAAYARGEIDDEEFEQRRRRLREET
ncbi:SHOCT domain-containing protein [Salinilacihabitans rarus]|uniref:SHOCT domain-containing protein n=1 Tax=Salinilacihabitans rarus TaxID=2961596 RepID=UPI0020C8606F|nr:SHOCT domain-containing protein [Salinilacihabitans rarus]